MRLIKKPDASIDNIDGRVLADDLKKMAKRLDIDLGKADKDKTTEILKRISPISDEIVKARK